MDFETWMEKLDKETYSQLGCSVHDLKDWNWRVLYDGGLTPKEAFKNAADEAAWLDAFFEQYPH